MEEGSTMAVLEDLAVTSSHRQTKYTAAYRPLTSEKYMKTRGTVSPQKRITLKVGGDSQKLCHQKFHPWYGDKQ